MFQKSCSLVQLEIECGNGAKYNKRLVIRTKFQIENMERDWMIFNHSILSRKNVWMSVVLDRVIPAYPSTFVQKGTVVGNF